MQQRVLICRSNAIAPDPRVEKIARTLANTDRSVTVIGWDRFQSQPKIEYFDKYIVQRLPIKGKFGTGLRNLPALIKWQFSLLYILIKNSRSYDVYHCCDFDTIIPGLIAKSLFRKHVVYDIFDFYSDSLRNTPDTIKTLIRKLEIYAINISDAVILVDDIRIQQISDSNPSELTIIYNSPVDHYSELTVHVQESKSKHLTITYVGQLQKERGLIELVEVVKTQPQWHLQIGGYGGDEEELKEISSRIPNVTWHGQINYEKTLKLSAQSDVLIATYDPTVPNHKYSSPNKVFEAMMLGKPLIAARGSNIDKLIEKYRFGIIVAYGNKTDLIKALNYLEANPDYRKKLGNNARLAYENNFSWDIMESRLISLYDNLSHSRS